jgi:hypothetical protein
MMPYLASWRVNCAYERRESIRKLTHEVPDPDHGHIPHARAPHLRQTPHHSGAQQSCSQRVMPRVATHVGAVKGGSAWDRDEKVSHRRRLIVSAMRLRDL